MLSKPLSRGGICWIRASRGVTGRWAHSQAAATSYIKVNKWNQAVAEGEKIVGTPNSLMSMRALMSEDFTNMAVHFKKLIGSDHPVLKTAKRLLYHGKNNMQVRGLLVLLLSRAAGPGSDVSTQDLDANTGILNSQRKLAELVEMMHSAQCIHRSVVNVPVNVAAEPDPQVRSILYQLEYGNKISILGGDYLLAKSSTGLASLRIPKIVELMSQSIIDFTQAEFLDQQDSQGRILPTADSITQECWEAKWKLGAGSLLGNGCECAILAANHSTDLQQAARGIGEHTALAIQAHDEAKLFSEDGGLGPGALFSLGSAPVLFHLQHNPELLQYINQFSQDLSQVDYKRVMESVLSGPGLPETKELCTSHVAKALDLLRLFPDNDGRQAYENMLKSLL